MCSHNGRIDRGARRPSTPPRRFPPIDGFDLDAGPEGLENPERQIELVRFQYTQTVHQEAWYRAIASGVDFDYPVDSISLMAVM